MGVCVCSKKCMCTGVSNECVRGRAGGVHACAFHNLQSNPQYKLNSWRAPPTPTATQDWISPDPLDSNKARFKPKRGGG